MFAIGLMLAIIGVFGSSWTAPGWLDRPSNTYLNWIMTVYGGVVLMLLSLVVLAWRSLP